jgi:hypothetical protein
MFNLLKGCKGGGVMGLFVLGNGFGIKLLVDGQELKDHHDRFLPGGRYHSLVGFGIITKWIILDFRSCFASYLHPGNSNIHHMAGSCADHYFTILRCQICITSASQTIPSASLIRRMQRLPYYKTRTGCLYIERSCARSSRAKKFLCRILETRLTDIQLQPLLLAKNVLLLFKDRLRAVLI